MTQPLPHPLSFVMQQVAQIVGDICRAVAARGGRDHSLIPLVNMTWNRISRAVQRFERLLLRLAAGRPAPVRRAGGTRAAAMRDPDAFRLPRTFCWLVAKMPETASFASQLRHFLDDPAMAALLAAEPRAVRILRPMCRMLGVAHPALGTREPAPARVRRKPAPPPLSQMAPSWPVPAPVRPARWVVWRRDD